MKSTVEKQTYNGWKNRQTWNCALWIGNDEPLYRAAVHFMRNYTGKNPYVHFCRQYGLAGGRTPDNIAWTGFAVDYAELNAMMRELVS